MGKVFTHATMSLDGFVAAPDDQPGELFEWYGCGEVTVQGSGMSFQVDAVSAEFLRDVLSNTGALIAGRRLFEIAEGWHGNHPVGAPVVVVTHRPPPGARPWPNTEFLGDVEAAVVRARAIAGGRDVTIASANIAQQALELGFVDEVCLSLVPVLFGSGVSAFAVQNHQLLEDRVVVQGKRALHLCYPVRRGQ